MYILIAAFVVFALIASGNAKKAYFIVAMMLSAHFAIDSHMQADYMTHFIIAASFNALTICAITSYAGGCKYTVKTLFAVMLLNIFMGLSDSFNIDVFEAYKSAAIGMYIMLIVSIGVGDGRTNSLFELGGVFNRLRSVLPSKV